MSDILKVSVPTSGYENNTRTNPITVNDTNIQNIVDPSKVMRPDGQSGNAEQQLSLNYESNFESFLAALKKRPNMIEVFSQIFFQMGMEVQSGIKSDFAQEIAKFMQLLQMSEGDLLEFLKGQANGAVRFHGKFFQGLQQVLYGTSSSELQREILNFLKTYNNVDAAPSTMKNIESIIKNMSKYLPSGFRGDLSQLLEKLQATGNQGNLGANAQKVAVLKQEIVPLLSAYIKRTNDLGVARDMITMLTLNIAKYEGGSLEKLQQSLLKMMDFKDFQKQFPDMDLQALEKMLTQKQTNAQIDQFLSLLESGIKGEGGWETKTVFQNIMQALLVNQSVYMPLMHFMLPVELLGNLMFSEIWVDPESEQSDGKGGTKHVTKLLIKFDIQDVGFFDLIIAQENSTIDLQLYYPKALIPMEKNIKKDIADLIEKNGLTLRSASFYQSIKPKTISEVFPKIYERKNGVNVKI